MKTTSKVLALFLAGLISCPVFSQTIECSSDDGLAQMQEISEKSKTTEAQAMEKFIAKVARHMKVDYPFTDTAQQAVITNLIGDIVIGYGGEEAYRTLESQKSQALRNFMQSLSKIQGTSAENCVLIQSLTGDLDTITAINQQQWDYVFQRFDEDFATQ